MLTPFFIGGAEGAMVASYMNVSSHVGNGTSQSIITNQNLDSSGGLLLGKAAGVVGAYVMDDVRGEDNWFLASDTTASTSGSGVAFTTDGFDLSGSTNPTLNVSATTYYVLTWLQQAGYLDIVSYTGNATNRTIAHSLGAVPNLIIVKNLVSGAWIVYHASNTANPETDYLVLDTNAATADLNTIWNDTAPTSSVFSLGTNSLVNANSASFVAYVFAELDGASKFGSYSGTGSAGNAVSNLGFLPKAVLIKRTDTSANWFLAFNDGSSLRSFYPDVTDGVNSGFTNISFNTGGFTLNSANAYVNASGGIYIYAAWK